MMGGAPIAQYHITFNYLTWRDIKGPLRGGLGGRITTSRHIVVDNPFVTRYKITDLEGNTAYDTLCVQAENDAGRISMRSLPIEGLKTATCNDLQMCKNEMDRVAKLKHPYCDTDSLTKGEVIQRLLCSDYIITLQEKYNQLSAAGLQLDPPSDDEIWIKAGERTGGREDLHNRPITAEVEQEQKEKPKEWPRVKFKMFLPETGLPGDKMLATAPSGFVVLD